jgi:cell division protein FtsB
VSFFITTLWGENGVFKLVKLKQIRTKTANENDEILRQNLLYVQEIEKLKEARFVEQKARTDLGFVKESETVFVVPSQKP